MREGGGPVGAPGSLRRTVAEVCPCAKSRAVVAQEEEVEVTVEEEEEQRGSPGDSADGDRRAARGEPGEGRRGGERRDGPESERSERRRRCAAPLSQRT